MKLNKVRSQYRKVMVKKRGVWMKAVAYGVATLVGAVVGVGLAYGVCLLIGIHWIW